MIRIANIISLSLILLSFNAESTTIRCEDDQKNLLEISLNAHAKTLSFLYAANGQVLREDLEDGNQKELSINESVLADNNRYFSVMASTFDQVLVPGHWACLPTRFGDCHRTWIGDRYENRTLRWFDLMLLQVDNQYTFYRLDSKMFGLLSDYPVAKGAPCSVTP